ncbi:MAG: dihydrofolate reductase [Rubricoccaceae bacterium]
MPEVVVIAAVAEQDRLIGDGLNLPWHIPADLKRFKALTVGHPLVMGRKTFDSLVHQFGGPLPNRENVVLTRQPDRVTHPGVQVYTSLASALAAFPSAERVFIGGGAGVYASVLNGDKDVRADRLELTIVEGAFEGDTFFPPYAHLLDENGGAFRLIAEEAHPAREGSPAFRFVTYVRDIQEA